MMRALMLLIALGCLGCLGCDDDDGPGRRQDAAVADLSFAGVRPLAEVIDAYLAAWNAQDDAKRLAYLEQSFLPAGTYSDSGPMSQAASRDELAALMKASMKAFPGSFFERTSGIDTHHAVVRFGWVWRRAGGATLFLGEDFLRLGDDGRIARVTGFYPDPPGIGGPLEPAVINFAAAWGRSADLNAVVTDAVTFVSRDAELTGKAALTAHLATRGGQLRISSAIDKHDGFVRASFTLADTDGGTASGSGQIHGHLALDGRLDEIVLFDGEIPPL